MGQCYEVTETGQVLRACHAARAGAVLVGRDFRDCRDSNEDDVCFLLPPDVAELMRTMDVGLYSRVKRRMPRIFETAVHLLRLSDAPGAPQSSDAKAQLRRAIAAIRLSSGRARVTQSGERAGGTHEDPRA